MEKQIIEKVARFVELSNKFIKPINDVTTIKNCPNTYVVTSGGSLSYINENTDFKLISELEQFEKYCNNQVQLYKEYKEWEILKKELKEYTESYLKITK